MRKRKERAKIVTFVSCILHDTCTHTFLQMAHRSGLTDVKPPPRFDFKLSFVSSIVTSGHKWIGVPWPCGVFITKSGLTLHQSNETHISYTDSPDTLSPSLPLSLSPSLPPSLSLSLSLSLSPSLSPSLSLSPL